MTHEHRTHHFIDGDTMHVTMVVPADSPLNLSLANFLRHIGDDHGLPSIPGGILRQFFSFLPPRSTAASDEAIAELNRVTVSPSLLEVARTCAICQDDLIVDDQVVQLPCNDAHVFHDPCIGTWLSQHGHTCPLCRFPLPRKEAPLGRGPIPMLFPFPLMFASQRRRIVQQLSLQQLREDEQSRFRQEPRRSNRIRSIRQRRMRDQFGADVVYDDDDDDDDDEDDDDGDDRSIDHEEIEQDVQESGPRRSRRVRRRID